MPATHFLRATNIMADELGRRGVLLQSSTASCSFSFFTFIHSLFLSNSKRTLYSHLCFQHTSAHKNQQFPLKNLRFPFTLVVLSCLCCKKQSLYLNVYLCKKDNPLCCNCGDQTWDTYHLILSCHKLVTSQSL